MTAVTGVIANVLFAWRVIDTVNLVARNVAVHPLDFRTHVCQHGIRMLGLLIQKNCPALIRPQLTKGDLGAR